VSLYRTWRPKSFADLVGQDAVVRTLRTALSSGKLAHAYLFSGPRGSGKTSAAKILARCIDCVLGPTPDPDNTCENCRAMLAGSALDVIEVDAASNRGIEEIRALRESVKFAPSSMRMKVFIIDEAHMLTREGANAFLKTLEEPPPHAVFILATTAPEALPATILSRCQRYAFRRIPVAVMIARMREIADAEGITIDDGALGAIAYRADGGLRDALTMLEQVASYAGGAVDAATVDAAFGATGRQYARALVDAILGGEAATALRVVDEASDAGADMLGLVRGAIAEYRNLLVARIDPELLSRDLSNADAEAVGALAAGTPQPKVVRGLRLLADALAAGRASGNPRLELETAVLRLIVQGEDPSLEALATRVALLEGGAPTAPAPVVRSARAVPDPSPVTAAPMPARAEPAVHAQPPITTAAPAVEPTSAPVASAPAPTLQQVRSLWDQIRLRVEEQSKPLRGPLSRATVDSLAGNALTISVPDDVNESILRDKLPLIESAIADSLRVPLRLVLRNRAVRNGDAHRAAPAAVREAASPEPQDGEVNLLAYARKKIGGTETS
jgi:DNA polymerase-3 subunit gamma/tau